MPAGMIEPPADNPPPPQGGGSTSDRPLTNADLKRTPDNNRPQRPPIVIPSENAMFVNVKCTRENQTLQNVNPFIIKRVLDKCNDRGFESVKKLRDGSLLVKVNFASQVKDLLNLKTIHDIPVKVTLPIGLNTCKGVVFCRDFRTMDESEILDEMKDQSVVDAKLMTKKGEDGREKTGLCFLTFASNKVPLDI